MLSTDLKRALAGWMTVGEAAELSGFTRKTLYVAMNQGDLVYNILFGRRIIHADALHEWTDGIAGVHATDTDQP